MTTLQTARLTMRPLVPADVEALWSVVGRDDVMAHYVDSVGGWSRERTAAFIDADAASWAANGFGRWGLDLDGDFIGYCGLSLEDWLPVLAAAPVGLSFRLHPDQWGKGLAVEAGRATLGYAFTELGLAEVVGCFVTANTQSRRALQKLGLRHAMTVPYTSTESGRSVDFEVWRATAETADGS